MPELDAERRERLVSALERANIGIAGDYDRSGEEIAADVVAPLVAGWLADDTAVCTTCQHRGGDDQPAQHPGCAAALGRIRAAALREAAEEAEERGDVGKDGGPEAWEWLRDRADRIGGGDE